MNLLVIIVLLVLLWKVCEGYKRGMVKEVISFVSLIVLCAVAVLIGSALQSYFQHEYVGVAVAVLLLCLVGIAHHLLGLVFFSARLISKLPVISWVNKLLGVVAGALETVLLLWTVYTFIMTFGMGSIGNMILEYTKENPVLLLLYRQNYLADWISTIRENISFIQL